LTPQVLANSPYLQDSLPLSQNGAQGEQDFSERGLQHDQPADLPVAGPALHGRSA
jgi:hypothetical protein